MVDTAKLANNAETIRENLKSDSPNLLSNPKEEHDNSKHNGDRSPFSNQSLS